MVEDCRPPNRVRVNWADAETAALIEAWEPIYKRRRDGEGDRWVPARRLGRVRSSRRLVAEDWLVVAAAVNAYRDAAGLGSHRTSRQCKRHVATLAAKDYYAAGAAAAPSLRRFFSILRGGVVSPTGTGGQPTGQPTPAVHLLHQMETEEAARQEDDDGSAVDVNGDDNPSNVVQVQVEPLAVQQQEDVSNGDTEVDTEDDGRADTAGHVGVRRSAAMAGLWGGASHIPKRPRSFGSTSGPANLGGGVLAGGVILPDSFADLLGSASAKGGSTSAVSVAAEVVMKVTADMCHNVMTMCQNIMMKSFDVEKNAATEANKEP